MTITQRDNDDCFPKTASKRDFYLSTLNVARSPEASFSSRHRLCLRKDFTALRCGRSLVTGGLRLVYRRNGLDYARIGLAVSRRYGNAVRRNRLKRQLRESFRLSGIRNEGVDVLVVPICDWKKMQDVSQIMSRGLNRIMKQLRKD